MEFSRDLLVQRIRAEQTSLDVIYRIVLANPDRPLSMAAAQSLPGRSRLQHESREACKQLYELLKDTGTVEWPLERLGLWMGACEKAGTWAWLAAKMAAIPPAVAFLAGASTRLPAYHSLNFQSGAHELITSVTSWLNRLTEPLYGWLVGVWGRPAAVGPGVRARLALCFAAPLWTPDFMSSAAAALRSCAQSAQLSSQAGRRGFVHPMVDGRLVAASSADTCARLTHACAVYACLATVLWDDLVDEDVSRVTSPQSTPGPEFAALRPVPGGSPDAAPDDASGPAPDTAAVQSELLTALGMSRLLPTVAWALLRGCPAPDPELYDQDSRTGRHHKSCAEVMDLAAYNAAHAVQTAHRLRASFTGDASLVLASQLSHPDVEALQEALLERLCVHGGVELEGDGQDRGQAQQGRGQRQQGQGQRQRQQQQGGGRRPGGDRSPAGSAAPGRWWLPALEARLGHAIWGIGESEGTVVRLQYAASPIIPLWRSLYSPAGGYSPSPRLARLAPRALEALCRLFRGEGLAGACSRRAWDPAFAQDVDTPVVGTRSAETLAWALALNLEGLEAGLEGGGVTRAKPLTEAVCGAALALELLRTWGGDESQRGSAPALLGAPSREALAAALTRAGLAASLDHALRLAFAAADRAALEPGNPVLQRLARETVFIPFMVPRVLGNWALPPQLRLEASGGVLVTLGKRARMLARRLRELEAEVEGSGAGAARAGALKRERELLAAVIHQLLMAMPGPRLLPLARDELGPRGDAGRPAPNVDAEAFVGQWMCLLATQAAARAAPLRLHREAARWLLYSVTESLRHVWLGCTSSEASLSAPRLLALQPQRLLAAACKLLCARVGAAEPSGGTDGDAQETVEDMQTAAEHAVAALAELAAHPQLSDRVRSWLVPPGGGGGSSGGGSGDGRGGDRAKGGGACRDRSWLVPPGGGGVAAAGGGAGSNCTGLEAGPEAELGSAVSPAERGPGERGCLVPALRVGLQPWLRNESLRGTLDALLRTAAPAGGGGGEAAAGSSGDEALGAGGDGSSGGEAVRGCDGGQAAGGDGRNLFRSTAAALAASIRSESSFVQLKGDTGAVYFPTVGVVALLQLGPPLDDGEGPPADESAALLAAPLPPPIAVPLAEVAFPGLRVCAYPGCLSYGGRSEAELPLKQCARCNFLPPNEIACTLRLVNRSTADQFREHTGVRLSQPSPAAAFAARWSAPGACRALSYQRRLQLLCLTAASGDVGNLEVALAAAGLCPTVEVMAAAAAAGQLPACRWLAEKGCPLKGPLPAGTSLQALASKGGHAAICEWLTEQGHAWSWECVRSAALGGHPELMGALLHKGPPGPSGNAFAESMLDAAARGCDLETLQEMWRERAAQSSARLDWEHVRGMTVAAAAGSPTPDWAAKVAWLLEQGARRHLGVCRAAAFRPDAVARLTLLVEGMGFPVDACTLDAAAEEGRADAVRWLLAWGLQPFQRQGIAAAERGHTEVLRALHGAGCPLPPPAELLRSACASGSVETVSWVVATCGAEALHAKRHEVFETALQSGSLELVTWLHGRGLGPGRYPWDDAAEGGCVAVLELQAEWGADAQDPDCPTGDCHLTAAARGDLLTLEALRRVGVPLGRTSQEKRSLVRGAFSHGAPEPALRWLREAVGEVDWAPAAEEARTAPKLVG
ncbi:hypothetical protein HYH03_012823 [Edaphochlamys debaryana]|uniref:Uncharacterized protein n=1 Tax=Edaphochlamys debaryana TaxID=47281 RepID=A0A835XUQ6_9CHLO|nr:hypothetical protein HYH03_012823 [Edaphochlamys debaryana]|eukprot:KAG2488661.1 hypothetical protein HYH03_012823 [Edaphochlamys debaryana]